MLLLLFFFIYYFFFVTLLAKYDSYRHLIGTYLASKLLGLFQYDLQIMRNISQNRTNSFI